jgi:hypothetical protein
MPRGVLTCPSAESVTIAVQFVELPSSTTDEGPQMTRVVVARFDKAVPLVTASGLVSLPLASGPPVTRTRLSECEAEAAPGSIFVT